MHTGLGPNGHGEHIFAGHADDAAALARCRAWWGDRKVTSFYDGSSTSAVISGMMFQCAYQECPQAEYTGIALEYGTEPLMAVIDALRADQWLENHPQTDAATRAAIKQQVFAAFCTDSDTWRAQVLDQGITSVRAALQGLAD